MANPKGTHYLDYFRYTGETGTLWPEISILIWVLPHSWTVLDCDKN